MLRLLSKVLRSGLNYRSCLCAHQTYRSCLCAPQTSSRMTSKDFAKSAGRPIHLSSATRGSAGEGFHRCSPFDKKILAWMKMYPSVADVPDEVTNMKMKRAKDYFRIRVNIIMALVTALLCVVYIRSGKQAAERGESVAQQNKDRHSEHQSSK